MHSPKITVSVTYSFPDILNFVCGTISISGIAFVALMYIGLGNLVKGSERSKLIKDLHITVGDKRFRLGYRAGWLCIVFEPDHYLFLIGSWHLKFFVV